MSDSNNVQVPCTDHSADTPLKEDPLKDRVEKLERLVDSLCVGAAGWRGEQQGIYHVMKNPALAHGHRLLRNAEAQNKLDQLDEERRILLEDYPDLNQGTMI